MMENICGRDAGQNEICERQDYWLHRKSFWRLKGFQEIVKHRRLSSKSAHSWHVTLPNHGEVQEAPGFLSMRVQLEDLSDSQWRATGVWRSTKKIQVWHNAGRSHWESLSCALMMMDDSG